MMREYESMPAAAEHWEQEEREKLAALLGSADLASDWEDMVSRLNIREPEIWDVLSLMADAYRTGRERLLREQSRHL